MKITVARILQKKYYSEAGAVHVDFENIRDKDIFIEDISITIEGSKPSVLCNGKPISEVADCFWPYFVVDSAPMDNLCMVLHQTLQAMNIPTINSFRVLQLCGDKFATLVLMQKCGFKIPKTTILNAAAVNLGPAIKQIERDYLYPVIVKPRGLLQSFGVIQADNREQLLAVLQIYGKTELLPIIQEFVPIEAEYRLTFVKNELLFAYKRSDPRNHLELKEKIDPALIPDEVHAMVRKALGEVDADCISFDFFKTKDAYVLNEINSMPGVRPPHEAQDIERFYAALHGLLLKRVAGAGMSA